MSFAEYIYTEVLKPKTLKTITNAILLHILPKTIQVGPGTICLNPKDPVVSGALTLRVFEPSEVHFFQKYCRGDMVVVDIGANVGLYTALAMHALTPSSRIIALEPDPESFTFLNQTIQANQTPGNQGHTTPRVEAFMLAASSEKGILSLFLNPENRGDSRSYAVNENEWECISVDSQTLDNLLGLMSIHKVNFVKIDVQGYEQIVVLGFQETLRRSDRVILMTEFWPKGLDDAGCSAYEYLDILTGLGFKLYELKERPRGVVQQLENRDDLVARLPGRKYTNLIGVKGFPLDS
jgi:FkbM family methyltransferase